MSRGVLVPQGQTISAALRVNITSKLLLNIARTSQLTARPSLSSRVTALLDFIG